LSVCFVPKADTHLEASDFPNVKLYIPEGSRGGKSLAEVYKLLFEKFVGKLFIV